MFIYLISVFMFLVYLKMSSFRCRFLTVPPELIDAAFAVFAVLVAATVVQRLAWAATALPALGQTSWMEATPQSRSRGRRKK